MVDDEHVATAAEQLCERGRGEPAALLVVAGHVRDDLAAPRGDVGGEHRDACALDAVQVRTDGVGVTRRDDDRHDALRDEILELRRLLRRIHLAGDDRQLEVPALGFLARAPVPGPCRNRGSE